MNGQNMIYAHNGILSSNKKGPTTDICYGTGEPQKHYTKWKKPNTRDYILYDSVYIKCPEKVNI